jgi:uncharacterized integral membrane protein
MLRVIRFILFAILFLLGLGFAVLNVEMIRLHFYFSDWQMPLSLALVIALAVGVGLGFLACLGQLVKMKRELSKLRKVAKLSETELINLRSLPLREGK